MNRPGIGAYARRADRKAHLEVQLSQAAVEALNGHAKRLGIARLALLSEIVETVLCEGLVTAVLDK